MANPEHVKIAKRGANATAKWRRQHPGERLDLSGAALIKADLSGADLSGAHLSGADLSGADLSWANLSWADLHGANLGAAYLAWADLFACNLAGARMSNCELLRADLSGADLTGSLLRGAHLTIARFQSTNLTNADLSDASGIAAVFADCDLSRVRGLESVVHTGPSSIGVDTLLLTLLGAGGQFTAEQRTFFQKAGVSKTLLDYLLSLLESHPIQFFSCFISYGAGDEDFADRLYRDLRSQHIRCWKYDVDAIPGREVWGNISRAIVLHEKMIVICSESSLGRPGVHGEIERALQKEEQLKREKVAKDDADRDTDVLVPVRLDDYVLKEWDHPRAADVKKKHIGDFREWQDAAKYREAFGQLLRALDPRSKLGLPKGDLRELAQGQSPPLPPYEIPPNPGGIPSRWATSFRRQRTRRSPCARMDVIPALSA